MQERFLSFYGKVKSDHAPPALGLWLLHGDEPILENWLIDALKPRWQQQGQLVKRMELYSVKSWHDVIGELSALDLFAGSLALIITGKHKPDTAALDALTRFAKDTQQGANTNHLLWCLPKQDKKSLTTKAIKLFDNQGIIIDATVYNEKHRFDLLSLKANEFGLYLEQDAWQLLLSHTEHNLLGAYQILWQLSFADNLHITSAHLQKNLEDSSQFDVFGLSDAILSGNHTQALHIISHLRQTSIAPSLILWALAKDAHLLLQLQANRSPSDLGIWQNKIHSYLQSSQRTLHTSNHWHKDLYDIDKNIKGLGKGDVWQQLNALALSMCGIDTQRLFTHHK